MSNQFIFDLAADIGTTLSGEAFHFRYDGYAVKALDEEMWVVGTTESDEGFPTLELNSPKLLLALLLTVNGPLPATRNESVLAEHIPSAKILEWCDKYGLLFNEAEEPLDGFRLRRARFEIASLYSKFKIWEGLVFMSGDNRRDDINIIRENLPRDQRLKTLGLVVPSLREKYQNLSTSKGPDHQSTIKAKNQLNVAIWEENALKEKIGDRDPIYDLDKAAVIVKAKEYLALGSVVESSSMLDFSGNHPRIKHYFNSLLDICKYQLNLLMTLKASDVAKHLKECRNPTCRALFWAKHGNERLCDICNPRSGSDGRKSQQASKRLYDQNNRPPRKPKQRKEEEQ